ncbi:hypothetical protein FHW31_003663 [Enterobacter asburiae]|nr:hypothetical protein [Enterobacter asburiae]NIH92188.1 hypothetical protein [Enterobacter asburiae]
MLNGFIPVATDVAVIAITDVTRLLAFVVTIMTSQTRKYSTLTNNGNKTS